MTGGDLPAELLPDQPAFLGEDSIEYAHFAGLICPDNWTEYDEPRTCEFCDGTKTEGYIAFDEQTREPAYVCGRCQIIQVANAGRDNKWSGRDCEYSFE